LTPTVTTKGESAETAKPETVRVAERVKTKGSWLPLVRRQQQLQTQGVAQAFGHRELRCGCDAEYNDERRICAAIAITSAASGFARNSQ